MTAELLHLIASAAEHAGKTGGDPADLFFTFTASLRQQAQQLTPPTETFETVHDEAGRQLLLHTCGSPRWRRANAEIVSTQRCALCGEHGTEGWTPAYRRTAP